MTNILLIFGIIAIISLQIFVIIFAIASRKKKNDDNLSDYDYQLDMDYLAEKIISYSKEFYNDMYPENTNDNYMDNNIIKNELTNNVINKLAECNGEYINESALNFINKLSDEDLKNVVYNIIDENYKDISLKSEYEGLEDPLQEKIDNTTSINFINKDIITSINNFYIDEDETVTNTDYNNV